MEVAAYVVDIVIFTHTVTFLRRRVNILCVQETRWACQKAKEVENTRVKFWYPVSVSSRNGVGTL